MSGGITIRAIVDGKTIGEVVQNVPRDSGGCWFCEKVDDKLGFSLEFDTYVHRDCIVAELQKDESNFEARLMAKEFGLIVEVDLWRENVKILEGVVLDDRHGTNYPGVWIEGSVIEKVEDALARLHKKRARLVILELPDGA